VNKFKEIVKDILYVSRLTKTKNKKILIFTSVTLSQFTAATDLFLIGIFSSIIANQFTNIDFLNNLLIYVNNNKFLIILLVVLRYLINYSQASILKKLELEVLVNLRVYIFSKILKEKNYSKSDSFFYINTLCGHIAYSFITSFCLYSLFNNCGCNSYDFFYIRSRFISFSSKKINF